MHPQALTNIDSEALMLYENYKNNIKLQSSTSILST